MFDHDIEDISYVVKKRYGASGQPCFTPLPTMKDFVMLPLK